MTTTTNSLRKERFCSHCKRCLHCNGMGYYVYDPDFYLGIITKFCGHCRGHGYK